MAPDPRPPRRGGRTPSKICRPDCTTSWDLRPLIFATKPTPHASCSFRGSYSPCRSGSLIVVSHASTPKRDPKPGLRGAVRAYRAHLPGKISPCRWVGPPTRGNSSNSPAVRRRGRVRHTSSGLQIGNPYSLALGSIQRASAHRGRTWTCGWTADRRRYLKRRPRSRKPSGRRPSCITAAPTSRPGRCVTC